MKHDVIFGGQHGTRHVSSVEELVKENAYVGFESTRGKFRYFVSSGESRVSPASYIVAIRPDGYWPSPHPESGSFYVFDFKKELLYWMAKEKT